MKYKNFPGTITLYSKIYEVFCLRETSIVYNTDKFRTMLGGKLMSILVCSGSGFLVIKFFREHSRNSREVAFKPS